MAVILAAVLLLGAAPAMGLSFTAPYLYATGRAPVAIAVADVNGDGTSDLLTANWRDGTVSVLLGRGDGRFAAKTDYETRRHPGAIAVADVNGDARPDVLTTSAEAGVVSVLLNDGAGRFGAKTDFATQPYPHAVAAGDLNGDGRQDLAVATSDFSSGSLSILLGDGAGGFAADMPFATGQASYDLAVADFNGDAKLDVATILNDALDGKVALLPGDGAGGFAPIGLFGTDLEPTAVAVADLNGDGQSDLVTAQSLEGVGAIGAYLGDGAGGFSIAAGGNVRTSHEVYALAVADLDGDGLQDVASAKSTAAIVLPGDGAGGFSPEIDFAVGAASEDIAAGDFNGDGKQDLAVVERTPCAVGVLLSGPRGRPAITRLTPAKGRVGATVTITGRRFGAERATAFVRFGAAKATTYRSWSNTKIRVKVPRGVPRRVVRVTVTTVAGSSRAAHFRRR